MKIEDLKFEVVKTVPACKKHPDAIAVEVSSESKKILKMAVATFGSLKGKLIIFYEETNETTPSTDSTSESKRS